MEATERDVKTLLKNVLDKLERGDESAPIAEEDYFITPKDICDDLQYFAEEIFDGEVTREQNAVLAASATDRRIGSPSPRRTTKQRT